LKGNLLIAHGGGPTAVINASLKGVIDEAKKYKDIDQILGAKYGVEGVLKEEFIDLGIQPQFLVNLLSFSPASAIGSCRRKLTEQDYPVILSVFKKYNIRYFFYNGGNDSMDTCLKIANMAGDYDIKVIGIPKTIDNDLKYTDHCPGFGSAARYVAVSTLELYRDLAALPIHIIILEVMGRNSGWLAAASTLGKRKETDPPHLVYMPECPFIEEKFFEDVKYWNSKVKGVLIVVSEGLVGLDGKSITDIGMFDGFGHKIPGGVAKYLSNLLVTKLGINSRSEEPGLLGRVSVALQSPVDREEANAIGSFSVKSAMEGKSGYMVAIKRVSNNPYKVQLELVPLDKIANRERKFPLDWINSKRNGIKPEFHEYCLPLIGEPLPNYVSFLSND